MTNNFSLYVIGLSSDSIGQEKRTALLSCSYVFSAEKYHKILRLELDDKHLGDSYYPIKPVSQLYDRVRDKLQFGNVAVIASGDPLFYGIATKLIEKFGKDRLTVLPDLSFMQIAFSRFKINWDDASLVTLHGRAALFQPSVLRSEKICFFTDEKNSPHTVAEQIKTSCDSRQWIMNVAEKIGFKDEYYFSGTIDEILQHRNFTSPNIVILTRKERFESENKRCKFGLKESEICHSRGLITKNEVRAVCLHQLALPSSGVFWDVGGGSGSISIEAARISTDITVYCVEKQEEQQQNILNNISKFNTLNISLVRGEAPDVLSGLPDADRIFIGGSGGNLKEIIDYCCSRLKKGGIIVINCVLQSSAELAPVILHRNGLQVEMSEVSIKRQTFPAIQEKQLNPITVVTGYQLNEL